MTRACSGALLMVWLTLGANALGAPVERDGLLGREVIQAIVDEFRSCLALPEQVIVAVVERDPLLVSVARQPEQVATFRLHIERAFLEELSEPDLRAIVAHELGHVWIFTHHPYLQTESLANRVALRLVEREHLVRVYEKVWKRVGTKGRLERFLDAKQHLLPPSGCASVADGDGGPMGPGP